MQEVKGYTDNLTTKYGIFQYAQPNTVLNPKILDRHLYDMLPTASNMLNRSTVPPPLPAEPMPMKKRTLAEAESQVAELTTKCDAQHVQIAELTEQNIELANALNAMKANLEKVLHTVNGSGQVVEKESFFLKQFFTKKNTLYMLHTEQPIVQCSNSSEKKTLLGQ